MALTFKSPAKVSADVVSAAAAALKVEFPKDYSDFLLETNGGVPKPRTLKVDGGDYKIEQLYSLFATPSRSVYELVSMNLHFRDELELPREYLALGLYDEQNVLLLTVVGEGIGTVSAWSFIESGFELRRVEPIAATFGEFLRCLEQPSDRAKERAALRKKFESLEMAIIDEKWAKVKTMAADLDQSLWPPSGTHPVFYAIECREAETVKQLYEAGIRFDLKDHEGQSPLEAAAASYQTHQDVIPFLISRGAKGPFPDYENEIAEAKAVLDYMQAVGIQ
ncbi:MAG: cell-wall [Schlesneria sp.]|nr:cell-wall [Schlesneria sp.]